MLRRQYSSSNSQPTEDRSARKFTKTIKTIASLRVALLAATATCELAPPSTGTTSLREEAQKKDILIGSGAINPNYLNGTRFAAVLAEQFNSLSPENEMKWVFLNPAKGQYNW